MTNKEFFIERWNREVKGTVNAVKALPADLEKLNYKPDAKSRSAIQIIQHILPHPEHLIESLDSGVINERDKEFSSTAEAAEYYEKQSAALAEKLASVDEETWNSKMVDFAVNDHKIFDGTMANMYWGMLFDTIHHRGQLSVYYRPMGVRNPSIYGPTAEDIEERMAAAAAQN